MSGAADWSVSVPSRHVADDGTVTVTAEVTDANSEREGTMTWTLTADGQSQTILDIPGLSGFSAWSTR